jgi:hypothetical protein
MALGVTEILLDFVRHPCQKLPLLCLGCGAVGLGYNIETAIRCSLACRFKSCYKVHKRRPPSCRTVSPKLFFDLFRLTPCLLSRRGKFEACLGFPFGGFMGNLFTD